MRWRDGYGGASGRPATRRTVSRLPLCDPGRATMEMQMQQTGTGLTGRLHLMVWPARMWLPCCNLRQYCMVFSGNYFVVITLHVKCCAEFIKPACLLTVPIDQISTHVVRTGTEYSLYSAQYSQYSPRSFVSSRHPRSDRNFSCKRTDCAQRLVVPNRDTTFRFLASTVLLFIGFNLPAFLSLPYSVRSTKY